MDGNKYEIHKRYGFPVPLVSLKFNCIVKGPAQPTTCNIAIVFFLFLVWLVKNLKLEVRDMQAMEGADGALEIAWL